MREHRGSPSDETDRRPAQLIHRREGSETNRQRSYDASQRLYEAAMCAGTPSCLCRPADEIRASLNWRYFGHQTREQHLGEVIFSAVFGLQPLSVVRHPVLLGSLGP
jgi:hypothetical protein